MVVALKAMNVKHEASFIQIMFNVTNTSCTVIFPVSNMYKRLTSISRSITSTIWQITEVLLLTVVFGIPRKALVFVFIRSLYRCKHIWPNVSLLINIIIN